MANMNDWNKLMANRGAVEALEQLRAEVQSWRVDEPEEALRGDVVKWIARMIEERK